MERPNGRSILCFLLLFVLLFTVFPLNCLAASPVYDTPAEIGTLKAIEWGALELNGVEQKVYCYTIGPAYDGIQFPAQYLVWKSTTTPKSGDRTYRNTEEKPKRPSSNATEIKFFNDNIKQKFSEKLQEDNVYTAHYLISYTGTTNKDKKVNEILGILVLEWEEQPTPELTELQKAASRVDALQASDYLQTGDTFNGKRSVEELRVSLQNDPVIQACPDYSGTAGGTMGYCVNNTATGFYDFYQKAIKKLDNVYKLKKGTKTRTLQSYVKQPEIDATVKLVNAALDNLVPTNSIDLSALHDALTKSYNKNVTPESLAALRQERDRAQAVMDSMFNSDGTLKRFDDAAERETQQARANAAAAAVEAKIAALERRVNEYELEGARFAQKAIDQLLTEQLVKDKYKYKYTLDSWNAYQAARAAATKAREDETVSNAMGVNSRERLGAALNGLRTARYGLIDAEKETITVHVSFADAYVLYNKDATSGPLKSAGAASEEMELPVGATVETVLLNVMSNLPEDIASTRTFCRGLVYINGQMYYPDGGGISTNSYCLQAEYKDAKLRDGDQLTVALVAPPTELASSQAHYNIRYMSDILDDFRYMTITAPESVTAGKSFEITVTTDGALPNNYTGAQTGYANAEIYTSAQAYQTAAEASKAPATTDIYVSTDANGKATLTLYAEGYVSLNAYRFDDTGRVTAGPTVVIKVGAVDDLSAIQMQLREELDNAYKDEAYPKEVFTDEQWTALQAAYNEGIAGIENAKTSGEAREAQMTALQTIKNLQSTADKENADNLKFFRNILNSLPYPTDGKLDQAAAADVANLKNRYNNMTQAQRNELTYEEKAKYKAISEATFTETAQQFSLNFEQKFTADVSDADKATIEAMVEYLQEHPPVEDVMTEVTGGNTLAKLFTFNTTAPYKNGTSFKETTAESALTGDVIALVNPDYVMYLLCREKAGSNRYGPGVFEMTTDDGGTWNVSDANTTLYVTTKGGYSYVEQQGKMVYTINGTQYAIRSIEVEGLEKSQYTLTAYRFYETSSYKGKSETDCNLFVPDSFVHFTMPFNDVKVTVTWGPAGGTSDEVETARTKALAVLDAEYAKYQAHENYETTIKDAYDTGKSAINSATTVDAINAARADAIRNLTKAAAGTDSSSDKKIESWGANENDPFDAGYFAGRVTVIFENTTCDGLTLKDPNNAAAAAFFYSKDKPFLTVSNYAIGENDSMMTVVLRALADKRYSWNGTGGSNSYGIEYISSITGSDGEGNSYTLAEFTGGNESGWMGTLNDFFVNRSFREFRVDAQDSRYRLSDGDVIRVMYTTALGTDLNGTWGNSDTTLKSLEVEGGNLTSAFASGVPGGSYDYTLAIDGDSANIMLTPTAANKNYLVRTYLNVKDTGAAEGSALYKRTESIPVTAGDVIYVGCGEQAWPSMNNQETEARDYTGTWYALHVISRTGSGSEVNNQITALPTEDSLSYDNRNLYRDQIEDAKHNLDNLDPAAANNIAVENQEKLDALLAKLDAYDALDELKAELQGMTLPAIGRMTDQAKLEKLLNDYNTAANSEELRQYLTDAEKNKAGAIKARLDELAAEKVISAIDAIGPVTKDSGAAIKAARDAYNELTDAQKELVTNYDKLTAAEARWSELNPVTPSTPAQNPFNPDAGKDTLPFTDVNANSWYYSGVKFAYEKGLMNGTGNGTFSPNADTTRGMIVTMLARLEGQNTSGTPWYAAGQKWAMDAGISDGTNMTGAITREQLAAILFRYAKQMGYDVSKSVALTGYSDAASVSAYATEAMRWAVANGLIQGSNSKLNPKGSATRAQVATILMRFMELYAK